MYNFGLEITSVFCGTVCPELLAQYHRNIQFFWLSANFRQLS